MWWVADRLSRSSDLIEPNDYEHVISFYNGSCAIIISQDRPGSSNSLTLSWLLVDEAKFIDYQKLKDETLPANGGIKSHFGAHSFNHSMMVFQICLRRKKVRGSCTTVTRWTPNSFAPSREQFMKFGELRSAYELCAEESGVWRAERQTLCQRT